MASSNRTNVHGLPSIINVSKKGERLLSLLISKKVLFFYNEENRFFSTPLTCIGHNALPHSPFSENTSFMCKFSM